MGKKYPKSLAKKVFSKKGWETLLENDSLRKEYCWSSVKHRYFESVLRGKNDFNVVRGVDLMLCFLRSVDVYISEHRS